MRVYRTHRPTGGGAGGKDWKASECEPPFCRTSPTHAYAFCTVLRARVKNRQAVGLQLTRTAGLQLLFTCSLALQRDDDPGQQPTASHMNT